MTNQSPHTFNDANFETEVLQSSTPVLVDFWAEWCPPCRVYGPTIDAVAAEYDGVAKVGKVDVDANPRLSKEYAIQSIPTTLLFVDGQPVKRFTGVVPEKELKALLDSALRNIAA